MINIGIIGGAGYTAGELLRILLSHPEANIKFVQSSSNAGNVVSDVHHDLIGETNLIFVAGVSFDIDVLFLCNGHGKAKTWLEENKVPASLKIIDLSSDFRIKDNAHNFIYGLPELNKEQIKSSQHIANCGCFATAIQLALLPLASENLLQDEIHVHAITGSTGAGQRPSTTTHFSWRNNNVSIYKAFKHQHLAEIRQSLEQLQEDFDQTINFLPVRGNFARGIFASVYINCELSQDAAKGLYQRFYEDEPFVIISPTAPSLKQVVNTNKGIISVEKIYDKLLIICAIDNLLKGASGQAVQNMNLMFGLPETLGLGLKAMAF